jgi:hypothetical protein
MLQNMKQQLSTVPMNLGQNKQAPQDIKQKLAAMRKAQTAL